MVLLSVVQSCFLAEMLHSIEEASSAGLNYNASITKSMHIVNSRATRSCRRAVETETKSLGKSWPEVKNMAKVRNRWRIGVIDALCPARE